MDLLSFPLVLFCLCHEWTTTHAAVCGEKQFEGDGQCCNMCPPGEYMEQFCTKQQQTVCRQCHKGYFSSQYSAFDICEKCLVCQQNYNQKCTPTTNAKCSCQHGFLCSNSLCSHCVENKCKVGEKPKQTQRNTEEGLIEFSYECEPVCPGDVPWNRTSNSVCAGSELHGQDLVRLILRISFPLLSVILILLLTFSCMKKLRRYTSCDTTADNPAIAAKTADFQLSQEESGFSVIIQDVSKDNEHVVHFNLEKVCLTNL